MPGLQELWFAERDDPAAMRVCRLCYGTTGGSLASAPVGVKIDFSSFAGYGCDRARLGQPLRHERKRCQRLCFEKYARRSRHDA